MSKILLAVLVALLVPPAQPNYKTQIERWRELRVKALTSDSGWLTVAGLFWLKEGKSTVGSASGNNFVLPKGSAPAHLGTFEFQHGMTTFQAAPGAEVTVDGKRASTSALKPDTTGKPDIVRVGALSLFVIQRGSRFGIRLKDRDSERRKKFTGLKYFPINEAYRVEARFVPYNPPKKIPVLNVLGDTSEEPSPGYVEFKLNGGDCRLDPIDEDGFLFFIFKDLTSGKETYPPGRFLYAAE